MPNLRSVVAQVHQKSRWIGSHRNFSSSPPPPPRKSYQEILAEVRPTGWFITRSFGVVIGYCLGSYYCGDMVAKHEERLLKGLRKESELRKKFRL